MLAHAVLIGFVTGLSRKTGETVEVHTPKTFRNSPGVETGDLDSEGIAVPIIRDVGENADLDVADDTIRDEARVIVIDSVGSSAVTDSLVIREASEDVEEAADATIRDEGNAEVIGHGPAAAPAAASLVATGESAKDAQIAKLQARVAQLEAGSANLIAAADNLVVADARVAGSLEQKLQALSEPKLVALMHGVVEREVAKQLQEHARGSAQLDGSTDAKFDDAEFDADVVRALEGELAGPIATALDAELGAGAQTDVSGATQDAQAEAPAPAHALEAELEEGKSFAAVEEEMAEAPAPAHALEADLEEGKSFAAVEQEMAEAPAPAHAIEAELESGKSFADVEQAMA